MVRASRILKWWLSSMLETDGLPACSPLRTKSRLNTRKGCCAVAGWLDDATVFFQSRGEPGRWLLAWNFDTGAVHRVADIGNAVLALSPHLSRVTARRRRRGHSSPEDAGSFAR
jgi:hypothetical protein